MGLSFLIPPHLLLWLMRLKKRSTEFHTHSRGTFFLFHLFSLPVAQRGVVFLFSSGSLPLFQMLLFPFQAKAKGTAPRPAVAKCARGCCASCCAFAFLLRSSSGSER